MKLWDVPFPTPHFSHHLKALGAKFKSASNRAAPCTKRTFLSDENVFVTTSKHWTIFYSDQFCAFLCVFCVELWIQKCQVWWSDEDETLELPFGIVKVLEHLCSFQDEIPELHCWLFYNQVETPWALQFRLGQLCRCTHHVSSLSRTPWTPRVGPRSIADSFQDLFAPLIRNH